MYRGTSLNRNRTSLGPYCRPMPWVLGGSQGGGGLLMSEVPLYVYAPRNRPTGGTCPYSAVQAACVAQRQTCVQGYLPHTETPTPQDHHMALCIGLL